MLATAENPRIYHINQSLSIKSEKKLIYIQKNLII